MTPGLKDTFKCTSKKNLLNDEYVWHCLYHLRLIVSLLYRPYVCATDNPIYEVIVNHIA